MNEIVEAINKLGEISWMDYVQLGATVLSIIISALAVFYAIKVPKKIAEEQNKITLFEKRYEIFHFYELCFDFCDRLFRHRDKIDLQDDCMLFFEGMKFEELNDDIVKTRIFEFEHILHQLVFLFPTVSDNDVKNLYMALWRAVVAIVDDKDVEQCRKAYVETMKSFSDKYQKMIFTEMSIYKCK